MKRLQLILVCALIFVLAFFAGSFIVLRQRHWCPLIRGAEVWLKNNRLADTTVYQCKDDNFIVWSEYHGIRAIQPKANKIGSVNESDFVKYADGLLSWDYPIYPELGDTIHPDAADYEEDPKLVITPQYFEYQSAGKQIRVTVPSTAR